MATINEPEIDNTVGHSTITCKLIEHPVLMCSEGHVEERDVLIKYTRTNDEQKRDNVCFLCRRPLLLPLQPVDRAFWLETVQKIQRELPRGAPAPTIRLRALGQITTIRHMVLLDVSTSMRKSDRFIPIPIPFICPSRFDQAKEFLGEMHKGLQRQAEQDRLVHQMKVFVFGNAKPREIFHDFNRAAPNESLEETLDNFSASESTTCLFDAMKHMVDLIHKEMDRPENRCVQFRLVMITDGRDTNSLPANKSKYEAWVAQVNELQILTAVYNVDKDNSGDGNVAKRLVYELDQNLRGYEVLTDGRDFKVMAEEYCRIPRDVPNRPPYLVVSEAQARSRVAPVRNTLEVERIGPGSRAQSPQSQSRSQAPQAQARPEASPASERSFCDVEVDSKGVGPAFPVAAPRGKLIVN